MGERLRIMLELNFCNVDRESSEESFDSNMAWMHKSEVSCDCECGGSFDIVRLKYLRKLFRLSEFGLSEYQKPRHNVWAETDINHVERFHPHLDQWYNTQDPSGSGGFDSLCRRMAAGVFSRKVSKVSWKSSSFWVEVYHLGTDQSNWDSLFDHVRRKGDGTETC
jgi:hypothetical protein